MTKYCAKYPLSKIEYVKNDNLSHWRMKVLNMGGGGGGGGRGGCKTLVLAGAIEGPCGHKAFQNYYEAWPLLPLPPPHAYSYAWLTRTPKLWCGRFLVIVLILAHLSRRLIWWAHRVGRPSVVRRRRPSSSTLFKHLLLRNHWANQSQISYWASMGWGNETDLVTWPRWPPCPYMVKTFKIFSGTKRPMTLKLGMHHWVLEHYQICSNDDAGLTLTYFTAR